MTHEVTVLAPDSQSFWCSGESGLIWLGFSALALGGRTMNLSGRVALITGGTRGIGLAIGRRLSDADARIAILARDPERLAVVDHKLGRSDDAVVGLRADVTDPAQVQEAVAAVLDRWGRINILVNNAGDVGRTVPTWELSDADWLGTLAVNLTGTFYCLRAVLPVMRAHGMGALSTLPASSAKKVPGNWRPIRQPRLG